MQFGPVAPVFAARMVPWRNVVPASMSSPPPPANGLEPTAPTELRAMVERRTRTPVFATSAPPPAAIALGPLAAALFFVIVEFTTMSLWVADSRSRPAPNAVGLPPDAVAPTWLLLTVDVRRVSCAFPRPSYPPPWALATEFSDRTVTLLPSIVEVATVSAVAPCAWIPPPVPSAVFEPEWTPTVLADTFDWVRDMVTPPSERPPPLPVALVEPVAVTVEPWTSTEAKCAVRPSPPTSSAPPKAVADPAEVAVTLLFWKRLSETVASTALPPLLIFTAPASAVIEWTPVTVPLTTFPPNVEPVIERSWPASVWRKIAPPCAVPELAETLITRFPWNRDASIVTALSKMKAAPPAASVTPAGASALARFAWNRESTTVSVPSWMESPPPWAAATVSFVAAAKLFTTCESRMVTVASSA